MAIGLMKNAAMPVMSAVTARTSLLESRGNLDEFPAIWLRGFRFLAHHRGSFLEFPCVLQGVVATSRPMRGQRAAGAGLPEELRSSFLGVETFQEYSRTCWGCLEARQGAANSRPSALQ